MTGTPSISVAIQGGAMRSIYCLGAVRALIDHGYAPRVKSIHTASAGCVSGVALASHRLDPGAVDVAAYRDLLLERLSGRQFINLRRVWKAIDVDRLVNAVRDAAPLSVSGLARAGLRFEVGMTDARTGVPLYLDLATLESDADLYLALCGTMAVPILYPRRVVFNGRRQLDGGISDPLPFLRALRQAPTLLIAVSSVARSHLGWELERYEFHVIRMALGLISPAIRHRLLIRNPLGAATEELTELGTIGATKVVRIAPQDQSRVGERLETRKDRLMLLDEMGYNDACQAISRFGDDH